MSTFYRGYKFQIYPTEDQAKIIDNYFHLNRYVYNWALGTEIKLYEAYLAGDSQKSFYKFEDLCKLFTNHRNQSDKEWLKKLPVNTARGAIRFAIQSLKYFFKHINGFPKFKSKKNFKKYFNTRSERFKIRNNSIKIEGINDYINLGFNSGLNIDKAIKPIISKDYLDRYFISFSLEEESKSLNISKSEGIGIDLGIRQTIVLSNGTIYNQPKEKLEHKRRKLQRSVTRDRKRRLKESMRTKTKYVDVPKSKRAEKREKRLHKYEKKIHNIKNTFYHTITKKIVERNPEYVCMETFSTKKIGRENPYLFKYLVNTSFYDITQKMKYKCINNNIPFIQAPITYPSTKTCNNCGSIKNMNGKHTYKCPVCGMVEDRDINAAKNLKNFGLANLY